MKASEAENAFPKLAPPGAGIPFYQRLALRLVVRPVVAGRAPWEQSQENFLKLTKKIRRELEGLTEEQLKKRVLVEPMRGLEDSSRYWSIAMTLDHILIVAKQVAEVIRALDAGVVPTGTASTAAVKPDATPPAREVLREFDRFCDLEFPSLLPSLKNRISPLRFLHPWFGPMNAKEWYWLLGTHHGVHLQQIRAIKKGL